MYQFDVIFEFLYLLLFFFYLKFFMNIIDMRVILFLNKKIQISNPANNCVLKVNNRNRKMCEICSKLTIKTPERRH